MIEVPLDGPNPGEVGLRRRVAAERRQIPGVDQLLEGRADDQVVIAAAQSLRPGRRRQANEDQLGIAIHPGGNRLRVDVGLVNDDEIDLWQGFATGQGLHAGDLHRRRVVGHRVRALDDPDVDDAVLPKALDRLLDELESRHAEHHPLALGKGALDDLRGDDRLAGTGRQGEDRMAMPSKQRASAAARWLPSGRGEGPGR